MNDTTAAGVDGALAALRCPACGGRMRFSAAPAGTLGRAPSGVLRCGCSSYPVVDGIPIVMRAPVGMFEHTTGAAQVTGVTGQRLVALIEQGAADEALLECLAVPALPALASRLLGWRLSRSELATRLARAVGKRRLLRELLARRDALGVTEVFRCFYRSDSPLDIVVGDYFNLRFGQPRHLAALSLLAQLPAGVKPLLDLACGCGHLGHYLTTRAEATGVVGVDLNFFHVWIARHWIAPAAAFVCADAGHGLPFADDSFSATVCSDAYHLIPERARLHAEIERCAPGRPGVVTRAGNAAVMPNEGLERTLDGYLEDVGTGARAWSESTLLQCYLGRRSPLAEPPEDKRTLQRSKWLSFVWNLEPLAHDAPGRGDWPHAAGVPGINPVYRRAATPEGDVDLRFEFPSIWYAYENHEMLAYHPRRARLTRAQLAALRGGAHEAEFAALISSFLVLGLPRRFLAPGAT